MTVEDKVREFYVNIYGTVKTKNYDKMLENLVTTLTNIEGSYFTVKTEVYTMNFTEGKQASINSSLTTKIKEETQ